MELFLNAFTIAHKLKTLNINRLGSSISAEIPLEVYHPIPQFQNRKWKFWHEFSWFDCSELYDSDELVVDLSFAASSLFCNFEVRVCIHGIVDVHQYI